MGVLKWLSITAVVVFFAAYMIPLLIRLSYIGADKVFVHRPGKCRTFKMNGSEDIALLPNNQALISSGFYLWALRDKFKKPNPNIYMLDFNNKESSPVQVTFQNGYLDKHPDFTPHGISHWQNEKGEISLYVISHWSDKKDSVEVFQYIPETVSLRHLKSISVDLMHNINDLTVVGEMEFYVTNDLYFSHTLMRTLEAFLPVNLNQVLYYNGATDELKPAVTGLKYPNGIAKSNNGRFIYVNNLLHGEVLAFTRRTDNTLEPAGRFPLMVANDNIFVDPTNGHLWITIITRPLATTKYFGEDRSIPIPGKVVHIAVDEDSADPFAAAKMEEVFVTSGGDGELTMPTIGVYHNHTLIVGTVMHNMMVCEVTYLIYE